MIAPALTLVLFNKKLRILPINVGRTNVQNPLDFVTALLVDRHKRGRLRHRGGTADMFSDERLSVHNCHGLGQQQCVIDGYRTKGDLKMGNEETIFNLNKSKGE